MASFSAALAVFLALHLGLSATGLRGAVVARIGEGPYRGLFALASAAALVWLGFAFAALLRDPSDPLLGALWSPPAWARHVGTMLVLLGFLLGVTGLLTPGPTLAGAEGLLKRDEPARGVLRITRHPFLWGVALWGAGHLAMNGERFAVMLFGGLALMALLGTRSIDRKGAARSAEDWARFAAVTSNIPFAAIVQGRNRLALGEMSWRLLAAAAAFAAVAAGHAWLVGAPTFP